MPRIAAIHAVPAAIAPVADAIASTWPEAETINLLDDSLSSDRARNEELTSAMRGRILALARYALDVGAEGILFTCSAFGEAIEEAARLLPAPVLKPNEAMFRTALTHGSRIGMLATFGPSVAGMEREFAKAAQARGADSSVSTVLVDRAMAALKAGDGETHDRLLAEAAAQVADCDAIMLAQFSTARARVAVEAVVDVPVLTSPHSAVAMLKASLEPDG